MASGAAAGGGAFDGCLNGRDFGMNQRPYHRNCKCALHKKKRTACRHAGVSPKANIAYPMRRSWSEGALALNAYANTSPCSSPVVVTPAAAGAVHIRRSQTQLTLFDIEDQD